ncbi:helix-turn-helix transcriptional regulator [Ralstonia pseudosolanacearum]|uniref:helix-turn-helix transcriptional regulator n=1 Tax=Ralstonia pseudosolanacearum TaxID=1310165 RepID=UPI001FFAB0DB|nr:hypothetical protein [Ralstonia pseudosolanacearum]
MNTTQEPITTPRQGVRALISGHEVLLMLGKGLKADGKPGGRSWLHYAVKAGAFPKPLKIGRQCRWYRDEIQDYIDARDRARYEGAPVEGSN